MEESKNKKNQELEKMKQFVLVHGSNHGAWNWCKVKPVLEASGHRVTVVDLTACSVNMSQVEEILTLEDYAKPLLEALEPFGSEDKVILVAHSLGGLSVALAADRFPSKISVAVFVTSFMPDTTNPPSYVFEKFLETATEEQLDFKTGTYGPPDRPLMSVLAGPNYLANIMYQLSPVEDLELAKTLVRIGPSPTTDLTGTKSFSEEGYGSVTRVYIVCKEDKLLTEDFQRWMIENFPVQKVMTIRDADHMAMFSKPKILCDRLLEIADKCA